MVDSENLSIHVILVLFWVWKECFQFVLSKRGMKYEHYEVWWWALHGQNSWALGLGSVIIFCNNIFLLSTTWVENFTIKDRKNCFYYNNCLPYQKLYLYTDPWLHCPFPNQFLFLKPHSQINLLPTIPIRYLSFRPYLIYLSWFVFSAFWWMQVPLSKK